MADNKTSDLRDLDADEIKKILRGVTIPPRPTVCLEIDEVYPDVEKVATVVSRDPGIASALLRTINSPFYGLRYEIKSIRQAAVYMGLDSVINLVNAVTLKGSLGTNLDPKAMARFWDSTNDTAVAMTALCQFLGLPSMADEAYTVGLFHNCGIPLLMSKQPKYSHLLNKAYQQADLDIMKVEADLIGSSHSVVSYFVCKTWSLSDAMCETILEHHNRTAIPGLMLDVTDSHTLLAMLKMAEHITMEYEILGGAQVDYEWEAIKTSVLDYFELLDEDFNDLCEQIIEQLDADQAQRLQV